jgi:hypothetical protein
MITIKLLAITCTTKFPTLEVTNKNASAPNERCPYSKRTKDCTKEKKKTQLGLNK